MQQRLAASLALVVFAICLVVGGLQTGNTFATTVWRALLAMAGTLVIGLLLGAMARRMLEENVKDAEKNLRNSETEPGQEDR